MSRGSSLLVNAALHALVLLAAFAWSPPRSPPSEDGVILRLGHEW